MYNWHQIALTLRCLLKKEMIFWLMIVSMECVGYGDHDASPSIQALPHHLIASQKHGRSLITCMCVDVCTYARIRVIFGTLNDWYFAQDSFKTYLSQLNHFRTFIVRASIKKTCSKAQPLKNKVYACRAWTPVFWSEVPYLVVKSDNKV